jgi:hypothetical protein
MMEWKVQVGDVVVRAASVEELREWVREERVLPENYVFHPVLERWMYVKELEELKAELSNCARRAAPFQRVHANGPAPCEIIICPNAQCGYKGPPQRLPRGDTATGCLLLLFFLIPGIFYFMLKSGYRYVCPKCGLQVRWDD